MIETNVLIAVLLWCGQADWNPQTRLGKSPAQVELCRLDAIQCASRLKDVKQLVSKCLEEK